ncbi:hypothetical protein C8R44DRAFT_941191, partial [Mycena epipterygia]
RSIDGIPLPHSRSPTAAHKTTFTKGSTFPPDLFVFANSSAFVENRGLLHDASLYPSPYEFIPERFLPNSGNPDANLNPDPWRFAFGYGRRVCPGRDLADDTLFIHAARGIRPA